MLKKLSAILLVLCMVVCLFTGCDSTTTTTTTSDYLIEGSNVTTGTDNTASDNSTVSSGSSNTSDVSSNTPGSKPVQQEISNPLKADLGGATITIYSVGKSFDSSGKPNTKADQAVLSMLKKLEKELNCKVDNRVLAAGQIQTSAFTTISSGKSFGHLVSTFAHSAVGFVSNKIAEDLKKVPTMDFSKDYLNVGNVATASTFGGGTWCVAEPINVYLSAQGVFFNKRILEEIGYKDTDLYKLVKNKQWTIDKMMEIAGKAVKDIDGKTGMSAEDRWGISAIDIESSFAPTVLEACGAKLLTVDSKGVIKYNVDNAQTVNAINRATEIARQKYFSWHGGSDSDRDKMFTTGKSLFFYAPAVNSANISNMEDDFGFLPFPSNKADGKYNTAVNWNTTTMLIPKGLSSKELANAGAYLQAYTYLAEKVNETINEDFTVRYFRDDESGENFAIAAAGQKLTTAQVIANINESILTGTYRVIWESVQATTPTTNKIQSSKKACITAVDEFMKRITK